MSKTLASLVIALVAYQAYVTLRVIRSTAYTTTQKSLQISLIWLLPLVGAAVVHSVFAIDSKGPSMPDKDFTPQPPNDGGLVPWQDGRMLNRPLTFYVARSARFGSFFVEQDYEFGINRLARQFSPKAAERRFFCHVDLL